MNGIQTRQRKFNKRFYNRPTVVNGGGSTIVKRAEIAEIIARTVAEDANTAVYVQEYLNGDFPVRDDYIEYMANRIEGILAAARLV